VSTDASRSAADDGEQSRLGERAARTRQAILDASRRLFLDRGYAGTRINNITDACGISRAGFYTYFQDKREVFSVLGETAYREILEVVGAWEKMPRPCSRPDVENWVRRYFAFMDEHGAFILSAQSKAPDEDIRTKSDRMQMRVWFLLGVNLRSRQRTPTDTPETLGLTIMAMLDRSWYLCRTGDLPVDDTDVVHTITTTIMNVLDA
jgi:AcrR family transcriptional regulator